MRHLPFALILFRLVAGPVLLAVAGFKPAGAAVICAVLLALGVLSDIFDGVIARRLNIVTDSLRLWDSRCDVVFWLSVAISLHMLHPDIWQVTCIMLAALGLMEATTHLISYVRFGREASTHHLLSKIFCLFLWALASQIYLTGETGWLFWLTLAVGIVSQLEAMAIMLVVPAWQVDVKGLKAALALRRA
ncbi:CDP-alcohol phosphatidyltransferase [Asticcacaulis sp. AC460]|uniref:CDP-alcohol phosphatidyltransferase family protein n=1 Tax=Asticcacaulis sp. AC460 TaxID=1282360 RepID=UPI0003C3CB07|nr:CDP-alcohol phosphatidyltransferase family protein [Asticcacaulis sp. AC460]ESQ92996.1 CDP-alcohol phosphatidyltransferase [Asticcacaulis sp. AC460]